MTAAALRDVETPPELPPALAEALRRKVEGGTLDLPVLAEAAQRVMRMATDEEVDAAKLAEAIKSDGAMVSHLLRVANSALYRGRSAIVSLQQAASRLGMTKVREIALAIVCESRVFRVKGFEAEIRTLFRHSLATAYFAQEIARTKRWNVEEAFLAGLLHDIGQPVLLQAIRDLEQELRCRAPRAAALAAAENLHAAAGASLAARWELPSGTTDAVRSHHLAEGERLGAVVLLADSLSHRTLDTRPVDAGELRACPALPTLNLYPEEVDRLAAGGDKVRAAVEALY